MSESSETKRILDYLPGDPVVFTGQQESLQGIIHGSRVSKNEKFFMYIVLVETGEGKRFVTANPRYLKPAPNADKRK